MNRFTISSPYDSSHAFSKLCRQILNVLLNLNHNATPNAAFDDQAAGLDHITEPDFRAHFNEFRPIEVKLKALPSLIAVDPWTIDGIDPEQGNPTQNEGRNAGWQIHTSGKTACCHRPPIANHCKDIGQRRRSNRVDS